MNVNTASLENMFTQELARLQVTIYYWPSIESKKLFFQARMAETEQQRRVRAAELRMLEEENLGLRERHELGLAELHSLEREIMVSEASLQREVGTVRQMPVLEAPPQELKV